MSSGGRAGRRLAWVVFGLAMLLEGLSLGIVAALPASMRREGLFGWPEALVFYAPLVLGFSIMGLVVAIRRHRNPVGWLMLLTGLWFGALSFAGEYATIGIFGHPGPRILPGAFFAAWVWKVGQTPAFGFCFLMLLLFPTGSLPGRWWRGGALVFAASFVALGLGSGFGPDPVNLDWRHDFVVPNPFTASGRIAAWLQVLNESWVFLVPLGVLLSAGSVVFRFATAQGEQRQQLKWVVCAVGLIGLGFALLAPAAIWEARFPDLWGISYAIGASGLLALPITIAIAVLRYRLYAIDLILNRAALYAALTLVLGAAFLVATGLSQYVVESLTGHRSDVLPAANGILVALAFQPVRRRARTLVDRVLPAREERALFFGDIVSSTARLAELGDSAWRETLAQYRATVRRELRRYGGMEVHAAGDGFFATFADPLQAVACGKALAPALQELGVATRFGLHWGPCEVRGEDVTGMAVWIAARVMAAAGPSEIVLSDAMRDVLESTGSDLALEYRGARALKGLPGEWPLHALPGS